jgi:hypothetical protein
MRYLLKSLFMHLETNFCTIFSGFRCLRTSGTILFLLYLGRVNDRNNMHVIIRINPLTSRVYRSQI